MKHNHQLTIKYSRQIILLFWKAYKDDDVYYFDDKVVSHCNKILSDGVSAYDYYHKGYRVCIHMLLDGEMSVTWENKVDMSALKKETI